MQTCPTFSKWSFWVCWKGSNFYRFSCQNIKDLRIYCIPISYFWAFKIHIYTYVDFNYPTMLLCLFVLSVKSFIINIGQWTCLHLFVSCTSCGLYNGVLCFKLESLYLFLENRNL
uniref:Uncharacterized protein n=1 Tax=Cacopsylla melanoneura TaxID=428564 RepID=A0A8D8UEH1_9HEMI